ncbi:MAG: polyphosphate kinase [Alphaproteobacteria bacterium PA4]|nr:MAG: polyphosphate kinase [Alphaproteobacteria bacterium PA4]
MAKLRLGDFETPEAISGKDYEARLATLQQQLELIQAAYIVQGHRGIVAVEGWDAAGKGGLIKRLMAPLDPRFLDVWSIGAPTDIERGEHYLERFWRRLPDRREITVFDRTWYGRVLVERVDGFATDAQWGRAYDEINQFEALQASDGVRIVKLFLHITQGEQDERLKERLEVPWKRWKTGLDDYHNRSKRADYVQAYHDMFDRTSTKIAPWTVIAADDKKAARLAGLAAVVAGLGAGVDLTFPDIDPALKKAAKKAGVL